MKKSLLILLLLACGTLAASAQSPGRIAVFPFKNLGGEAIYDSLSWAYTDSLVRYLNAAAPAGELYTMIPVEDIRREMAAKNIQSSTPSYETDVWDLAKSLGATKIVWGTYLVKYNKANIEAKIIDLQTMLADGTNFARKIRPPYDSALESVPDVGMKLLPGLN